MNRAGRVGKRIQEGSLYVLLFLLPFSKASVEISFGFLLLGWLVERFNPSTRSQTLWRFRPLRCLAWAVGAYLVVCALSVTVSDFPMKSIRGFTDKWLEYLLFFVIVADIARRPSVIRRSLTVLAWSSLCVAIYAIIQDVTVAGRYSLHPASGYGRMTGPYENPIDLATYLMVLVPVLLGCAFRKRGLKRVSLWALLLVLVGCLARTEAFGAWVGLWMGLAVMAAGNRVMWQFGLMAMIGSLIMGGVSLLWTGRLRDLASLAEIGKVDRWAMWQAAIGMIRDRPILGHGVNTFMAKYLDYWVAGERMPRYAHNCYLQVAAETGLIGLAVFLWLLWCLFSVIRAGLRQSRSEESVLLAGFLGGLFAFVVQAGLDTNFYALRQAALFWVLAGLAVGLSEQIRASST